MRLLVFFFLSSFTIFLDFYFLVPTLTFANLSLLLIVYLSFLFKDKLIECVNESSEEHLSIIKIAFIFIIYIFIINMSRGISTTYSIKTLVIQSACILCLPLFNFFYYREKYNLIRWIHFFIIVHFVFVLFQIFGFDFTLKDLVPKNFLIGINEIGGDGYVQWIRATGAISSPISLGQQAIAFLVITLVAFNNRADIFTLLFLFFSVVILMSTQARAAILSFIPLMILSNIYFKGLNVRKIVLFSLIMAIPIYIIIFFSTELNEYLPYVFKDIDHGDTHRYFTNIYISKGVLLESPFTGIAPNVAWDIFEKYADINYHTGDEGTTPTHHNQIFYYLRYYGLIGVAFLFFLYFKIFKSIKESSDKNIAYIIGSIFILDAFYSMSHNNKIFSPLLWIYLSLIFVPSKKKE